MSRRFPAPRSGSGMPRPPSGARLAAAHGIVAVGAWLSGTGLAQVVPDARAQADSLRHAALFDG